MILIETKGCVVTRKKVKGEGHLRIPSSRREFKLFQELEESQYSWRLKGKIMRGQRCHWKSMWGVYNTESAGNVYFRFCFKGDKEWHEEFKQSLNLFLFWKYYSWCNGKSGVGEARMEVEKSRLNCRDGGERSWWLELEVIAGDMQRSMNVWNLLH